MSSRSEINFQYSRAMKQAQQLDSAAARLKRAADNNMEAILNEVYLAWKSENTPLYIRKGQKVEQEIHAIAENLTKTANTIRTVAERLRAAELEAWRIAHEKSV